MSSTQILSELFHRLPARQRPIPVCNDSKMVDKTIVAGRPVNTPNEPTSPDINDR